MDWDRGAPQTPPPGQRGVFPGFPAAHRRSEIVSGRKPEEHRQTIPLVQGIKRAVPPSTPEGRPDDHRLRVTSPMLEPGKRNADLMSPVGGDNKRQELQEAMEAGDPVPMSPDNESRPPPPVDQETNKDQEDGMEFQNQPMEAEQSDEDL